MSWVCAQGHPVMSGERLAILAGEIAQRPCGCPVRPYEKPEAEGDSLPLFEVDD